jgi:hypothetical protein
VPLTLTSFGGASDILDITSVARVDNFGNLHWNTGTVTIQSGSLGIELIVKPGLGQAVDIVNFVDTTGTTAFQLKATGQLVLTNGTGNTPLIVQEPSSGGVDILDLWDTITRVVFSVGPSGATAIHPTSNVVPLTIEEASAGTSDLVDLKSASAVTVVSIGPSGATAIHPTSNVVPLTIEEASAGTSDLVDLKNASAVTVVSIGPTGATKILPSSNVVPLILQESSAGTSDVLDINNSSGNLIVSFGTGGAAAAAIGASGLTVNAPSAVTGVPGIVTINDTNGPGDPIFDAAIALALQFGLDPTVGTILMIPSLPGFIMETDFTTGPLVTLFAIYDTSSKNAANLLAMDPSNILGYGTNALIWGEDGTSFASGSIHTGNMKFMAATGSDYDFQDFSYGLGPTPIRVHGRQTAQTGAIASLATFKVGATDSTFEIGGNVNVTAYVAGSFSMVIAYADETNTLRTAYLNFSNLAGAVNTAIAAAGPFHGFPITIRAKATSTMTLSTTGVFTNLTYNAEAIIKQVAAA